MRNIRVVKKQSKIQLFSARAFQGDDACFFEAQTARFGNT